MAKGRKGRGAKCGAGAQSNSPASGPDRDVTRFTGEPRPTTGTGTSAAVAQATDQRICVLYKRLSGPLCSLVVVVTDGVAGTAAQWSRDTTFFGFSNVHDCALLSRLLRGWQ